MTQIADELSQIVQSTAERLRSISAAEAGHKPSDSRWSKKEVIGHLIDSAANNHQRFVRALQVSELVSPAYDQEKWVSMQDYNSSSWPDLKDLWRLYNMHLVHVIRRIPDEKLQVKCTIGDKEPVTLGSVIDSYLTHLKHHLDKIGAL
jgi:DinB superfamily